MWAGARTRLHPSVPDHSTALQARKPRDSRRPGPYNGQPRHALVRKKLDTFRRLVAPNMKDPHKSTLLRILIPFPHSFPNSAALGNAFGLRNVLKNIWPARRNVSEESVLDPRTREEESTTGGDRGGPGKDPRVRNYSSLSGLSPSMFIESDSASRARPVERAKISGGSHAIQVARELSQASTER